MIKIEIYWIVKIKTPPAGEVALGLLGVNGCQLKKQFSRRHNDFILLCGLQL
jgi:hypothetical protein